MATAKPFLIVFAGPNGSGKSSLTRGLQAAGYDLGAYINPRRHRGRARRVLRGSRPPRSIDSRRAPRHGYADGTSFSFETVFSHPSKLDVLDQARHAGFDVRLFFVGLDDPALNVERVATRVRTGGHDVPEDRIVARYHRTMALLPPMIMFTDQAWIFDNTVRAKSASEFAGRLVAHVRRDGTRFLLRPRYPLPDWVERYLIRPMAGLPGVEIEAG